MKNYLTIYLQYINGNPKTSINIKANYSLKMSYQSINNWWEKIWGAFHASRIEKRKINSKPRVASRLSSSSLLRARVWDRRNVFLISLQRAAQFSTARTAWTGINSTRTIFFRAWIRSICLSFWSKTYTLNAVSIKQSIFNAICNVQCGEYLI